LPFSILREVVLSQYRLPRSCTAPELWRRSVGVARGVVPKEEGRPRGKLLLIDL